MAKIYVCGAGGAPSNNFIACMKLSGRQDELIGGSSSATDLFLADIKEAYLVPPASSPEYPARILAILRDTRCDFIHAQHDFEVLALSELRDQIHALDVRTFLPSADTVRNCVDKAKSYEIWRRRGVKVPETRLIASDDDLRSAFSDLGPKIWLRARTGAGGRGSLPTANYEFARIWIDHHNGWGEFTAAECLTPESVTWSSIWYEGELIVAQTRGRRSWHFGNRTMSGVTGVTGVGETQSHPVVTEISERAVYAIDNKPHGIFSVDLTYDESGTPNPTEINIGRFFTTHLFFAQAGLNLPKIYCDLAIEGKRPNLRKIINPLPDGLLWIRGMDVPPKLTTVAELEGLFHQGVLRKNI